MGTLTRAASCVNRRGPVQRLGLPALAVWTGTGAAPALLVLLGALRTPSVVGKVTAFQHSGQGGVGEDGCIG